VSGLSAQQIAHAIESAHPGTAIIFGGAPRQRADESTRVTVRELEVLELITRGLTNQEIADQLFLSVNSVKAHIRAAYRKVGVSTRPQAVAWGVRSGFGSAD
jgi:NarL family two-component system response regulator LiaR